MREIHKYFLYKVKRQDFLQTSLDIWPTQKKLLKFYFTMIIENLQFLSCMHNIKSYKDVPSQLIVSKASKKKRDVLFIIGDWNAKVGSWGIPGVTSKFDLGIQNKAEKRLIKFSQENTLVIANTLFPQHKRRLYTWTFPDRQYRNLID